MDKWKITFAGTSVLDDRTVEAKNFQLVNGWLIFFDEYNGVVLSVRESEVVAVERV